MNKENKLKNVHWINECPEPIQILQQKEYPIYYNSIFGEIPHCDLQLEDISYFKYKFNNLLEYLESLDFIIYNQFLSMGRYIFIKHNSKIIITVNVSFKDNDADDIKDDEDESFNDLIYSESARYPFTISFCPLIQNKEIIENIIGKIISEYTTESNSENKFYMISQSSEGLFNRETSFKTKEIKDERYDLFYGKKFPYDKLNKFIHEETENLLLLHGDPGTGKSNFIKHLISKSKKNVIYIPPSMLSVISTPQFVSYMLDNKDSILLIEDAEEFLSIDRNSATNNLLGLTDGFLKDSLNLKIICTFNCDIGKIDPALLRKGRLYFEYKFDRLTKLEAQELANYCNLNFNVKDDMTLAELFNHDIENTLNDSFAEKTIGFC